MKRIYIDLILSCLVGILGASILHALRGYFTIDLSGFIKSTMGLLSAVLISIVIKHYYDVRVKIKDFKLDGSAPSKIHEQVSYVKQSYLASDISDQSLVWYFCFFILFLLGSIGFNLSEKNDVLQYFITNSFFFSFVAFLFCSLLVLNKAIRLANNLHLKLQDIEAVEKNRKSLIEELSKKKSTFMKDKKETSLHDRYKEFDLQKYVDSFKEKSDGENGNGPKDEEK